MQTTLLIIHILAAAVWLGTSVAQAYATPRLSAEGGSTAATWQHTIVGLGKHVYPPAALVVLITGFGLIGVSDGAYGYGDPFVVIGILMVILGAALGIRVFGPLAEKAAAAFEEGDRSAAANLISRARSFSIPETALLVFTFVVMVNRWGA